LYRAFLYFSQDRRGAIKDKNPGILNTDVSRILGEMWRNSTEEEKKPYRDHEAKVRGKYKTSIGQWREEQAKKEEEAKKLQEENTKILIEQRRKQQEAKTAQGAHHSDFWTPAWDSSHLKASSPPNNYNNGVNGTAICESDDVDACLLSRTVVAFPFPLLTQTAGSNINTDYNPSSAAAEMSNHLGLITDPPPPAQSHGFDVSYHYQPPPPQTGYYRNDNEQAHDRGSGHSSHEKYLSTSYLPSSYPQQSEPYARGAEPPVTPGAYGPGAHDAHSYHQTGQTHEKSAYASSEAGAAWSQQYGDYLGHLHQPTESQHNVYPQAPGPLPTSYDKAPAQNYHQLDSVPTGNELRPYSHQAPVVYTETTPRSHESSGSQCPAHNPPGHFSSSGLSHPVYSEQARTRHHSIQPHHDRPYGS
jgi:hypothetical protein